MKHFLFVVLVVMAGHFPIKAAEKVRLLTVEGGGWKEWSPRVDISPEFQVGKNSGREGGIGLSIRSGSAADYGAWRRAESDFIAGRTYRLSGWYKARNVQNERRSLIARLEWLDSNGKMLRPPEYGIDVERNGDWKLVTITSTAPEKVDRADIQLSLGFTENAQVTWSDVVLEEVQSTGGRIVRAGTIFHRPRGTKSATESVEQFCALAETSVKGRLDILCLPEGITVVGNGKSYVDVSEKIPGPTTERLGKLARRLGTYIVAGIYEREGKIVYNTSLLVGRDGKLVGKYRKTHLPREEWEAGITPGDEYPVFDTDFGKVAMLICWDLQFPEPWRAVGAQGAELVLLPIWGGNETLAKARAIENHLYVVSSSYDMKTFVVNPVGEVIAEASEKEPVVFADIELDKVYYQPWLGNMKNRTWKEWRPDIAVGR